MMIKSGQLHMTKTEVKNIELLLEKADKCFIGNVSVQVLQKERVKLIEAIAGVRWILDSGNMAGWNMEKLND